MTNKFTIRDLTSAGFKRREDLDFRDDGAKFKALEYNGIIVTYTKYEDEYFLAVRTDYLKRNFTHSDWCNTEEYILEDEFNGCNSIDVIKLISNINKIKIKVEDLNSKVENEELDLNPLIERASLEVNQIEDLLDKVKKNFDWIEANESSVRNIKYYCNNLKRDLSRLEDLIKKIDNGDLNTLEKRNKVQFFEKYQYIIFKEDNYPARNIKDIMNNQ